MTMYGFLSKVRKFKKMRSVDCAQRAGVSLAVWSAWESRELSLHPDRLRVFAKTVGVDENALISKTFEMRAAYFTLGTFDPVTEAKKLCDAHKDLK